MKIIRNRELKQFFQRCNRNLENDAINNYVGVIIQNEEEAKQIQQELHDIGDPEFQGSKESWPSLYIDIDEFLNSPYHKNIHLEQIQAKGYEFNTDEIPSDVLFNIEQIKPDPKRELNDYMVLRAYPKSYKAVILKQNGEYWMTDNPVEANTINPCVDKAKGNVLTFGLGIGYFIYMCLLKEEVSSVTVVELNQSVIDMFKKHILPQFPKGKEVKIIQGNALDYFNRDFLNQYDYVFADVWMNPNDGYPMIEKMLERYNPVKNHVDFWIEDSCLEVVTSLIYQYFEALSLNQKFVVSKEYSRLAKKIQKYFEKLDITVSEEKQLKDLMYDHQVLRDVVATKI